MIEHKPSAEALCNGDFVLLQTCSGYRSYNVDADVPPRFLSTDAVDEEVGNAVLSTLSLSRQIAVDEIATFYDLDRSAKAYADWMAGIMSRYGYKTKRALFKGMKNCGIQRTGDIIRFEPMKQVKLDSWEGTAPHGADDVVVSADSSPAEVGAAFRVALDRCS